MRIGSKLSGIDMCTDHRNFMRVGAFGNQCGLRFLRHGNDVIEFPAGLINDQGKKRKESLVAASRRELLEETGYTAKKFIKLLDGPASGGSSADILNIVRAQGLQKVAKGGYVCQVTVEGDQPVRGIRKIGVIH